MLANGCLGTSPHQQGRGTKKLSFCGIDGVVWADRTVAAALIDLVESRP
jgi:hypothetical protein